MKKLTTSPMNSRWERKILFSDNWIRITLYQRYTMLHEVKDTLCRFLLIWYKRKWKSIIDQIISLFSSQNYQNHKSLELEIVVKRVVLVFFVLLCCVVPFIDQQGYCLTKLFCCKSMLLCIFWVYTLHGVVKG